MSDLATNEQISPFTQRWQRMKDVKAKLIGTTDTNGEYTLDKLAVICSDTTVIVQNTLSLEQLNQSLGHRSVTIGDDAIVTVPELESLDEELSTKFNAWIKDIEEIARNDGGTLNTKVFDDLRFPMNKKPSTKDVQGGSGTSRKILEAPVPYLAAG